ncbi:unnamed protein product [Prunus armeniaca]
MVVAEVPSSEVAAVEVPSAAESTLAALTGPPFAVAAVPSLAAMVPVGPSPVTPRRPSCIVIHLVSVYLACQSPFLTWVFLTFDFRLQPPRASLPVTVAVVSTAVAMTQEPLAEDDIAVVEPLATATPILTPTASVSMSMPQPSLSLESKVMPPAAELSLSSSSPPQMTSPKWTPAFTRRDVARFRTL